MPFRPLDIGLMRALAMPDGRRPTSSQLLALAERWRPWRGLCRLASVGVGNSSSCLHQERFKMSREAA